jgi:hypothetical protein
MLLIRNSRSGIPSKFITGKSPSKRLFNHRTIYTTSIEAPNGRRVGRQEIDSPIAMLKIDIPRIRAMANTDMNWRLRAGYANVHIDRCEFPAGTLSAGQSATRG